MSKNAQFKVLLPPDVKNWLEYAAKQNVRSQGAEIVACLREKMSVAAGVQFGDHAPAAVKAQETNHSEAKSHAAE